LEERATHGAGQGGGGSLAIAEMKRNFILPGGRYRIAPGTILHTDGTKAYRKIGLMH
jgi:hypothetical protein